MVAAALVARPATACAYTQWAAAITLGGGARVAPEAAQGGVFSMGLRADALFGARSPFAWSVGPFAHVWSDNVDSLRVAAGVSLRVPVHVDLPLVLSVGAMVNALGDAPVGPGLVGRVWWGTRSVNYHSAYGMAAGLWLEARYTPDGGACDVVAGLDADLGFVALPAVALWNWLAR